MFDWKCRLAVVVLALAAAVSSAPAAGVNVPDSYQVFVKEFSLCEDAACTSKSVLFSGMQALDVANLNKKEVQQLVPPTAIVRKGSYGTMRLVLQNRILMRGSAAMSAGQYCSTDGNATRNGLAAIVGANNVGLFLLSTITALPNATSTQEFWLPNGSWAGGNWRMEVNQASVNGTITITLNMGSAIDVPSDIAIGNVSDPIYIYFDVDEGVLTRFSSSGPTKCAVLLGAPKIHVEIGNTSLVDGAQPNVGWP